MMGTATMERVRRNNKNRDVSIYCFKGGSAGGNGNGRHVRYIMAWHSGTIPMLTCAFQQRQNYSKGERKL